MTDTELLQQAQRGDVAAWRSLYARCLPLVWRQSLSMVGDESVAEDVVGEVMLAFVRSLPSLDADAVHLYGWLRGVVRNKVGDHGRRRARRQRAVIAAQSKQGLLQNGTEDVLELQERRQQVRDMLEELPEHYRHVLEWRHFDSLGIAEIAERVGQTEKAIESMLYRARERFRRLYEARSTDKEPKPRQHVDTQSVRREV